MLILTDIQDVATQGRPLILAMGCFDGVHIGHQKVISTAVEQAKKIGGEAWIYTFNPHPAKVLVPHKAPPLISAEPCRIRQMNALGVKGLIEIPFTHEFTKLSPEAFLNDIAASAPSLAGVVCGQDWSFGCRASGNFQTLETFGKQHGFTATAVSPVMDGEQKISSTTIRKAVANGNIPLAEKLLGRPVSLFGTVIPGNKIGRELGYPTANIDPLNELIPGDGVYAAYTKIISSDFKAQRSEQKNCELRTTNYKQFPSAVFIGNRETFGCHKHTIESYLLDFNGDLYGQDIEIALVEKTREVTLFPSKEALIEQIGKDITQIHNLLIQPG